MTRSERAVERPGRSPCALLRGVLGAVVLVACGGTTSATPEIERSRSANPTTSCPELAAAPDLPPGTRQEHRDVGYWRETLRDQVELDRPLLDDSARSALASTNLRGPHRFDLSAPPDARFAGLVAERSANFHRDAANGVYFDETGRTLGESELLAPAALTTEVSTHRALAGLGLRCTAREASLFRSATDRRFDRNRCSFVEAGELVERVGTTEDGQVLLRTGYSFGYVRAPALGPALDRAAIASATPRPPAFTRAAVLDRAFAELDREYGWGGQGGGLDCSSFVLSVIESFGIPMPRFSGDQAEAGSFRVDLPADAGDAERLALLDAANRSGLVLVHFPGHVMLYLGRSREGAPMAIHAYAEYVEPCAAPEGGRTETVRTVSGVDVTTLELGRGTSRTSYLERMRSLTVFGAAPVAELQAHLAARTAVAPPSATCAVVDEPSIVRSPRRPYAGGPVRLIWVGERSPGPTAVSLTSATGERVELPTEPIEGPPYGLVARWDSPRAGTWTAWFGDGERRLACEPILVEPTRSTYARPVNSTRNRPTPELEALWSVFVQKLFDHPIDDRTWPDLQSLLRDRDRNLLYDHFTAGEEERIALEPDCADLPFVLRAYFAWKMGMPFAVRSCSRGGAGRPPSCASPVANFEYLDEDGVAEHPIEDFRDFATSIVANTVHSASLRTTPDTNASDLYPVPLTREALRPGTVYADPYGHVMMIVRWVRGTAESPGMLIAADAQPDGTIGRPRFWRGTFLFTPETHEVGAGFKAFRPVERRGDRARQASNDSLRAHPLVPYSTAQYEGDADSFYDRVEALIDPQPLDAERRLIALVDALHDSARRRTISVDNAETFFATRPGTVIPMPEGPDVFQTEGPWEDFSTPSRDMRLLLALDTVLGFPEAVRRRPERFGLDRTVLDSAIARLRTRLDRELAARAFEYRGTGGARTTLTLADLRARIAAFEVAYDPNDCPEVRWGAPAGSPELARCARRAPPDQRRLLERYRVWFAERRRPLR